MGGGFSGCYPRRVIGWGRGSYFTVAGGLSRSAQSPRQLIQDPVGFWYFTYRTPIKSASAVTPCPNLPHLCDGTRNAAFQESEE